MADTSDTNQEESGEAEEINDDDIEAIDEPILDNEAQESTRVKSWRPSTRLKEKRRLERSAAELQRSEEQFQSRQKS